MKKKLLTIGIVPTIAVVFIGCYSVLNCIFPKANLIDYPAIETIVSVSVACNDSDAVVLSDADFDSLLLNINNAYPTRMQSLNDYPTVRPYYIIGIHTSAREYRYFVYEENHQVYIEIPYEGIYMSDNKMLDLVLKYYTE